MTINLIQEKAMTKKEALQITIRLWKWLYQNPFKLKSNWPEWKINGGNVPTMLSNCSLCDFVKNASGVLNCEFCPLKDFWPHGDCINRDSAWWKWEDAISIEECKEHSKAIYEAAEFELSKEINK